MRINPYVGRGDSCLSGGARAYIFLAGDASFSKSILKSSTDVRMTTMDEPITPVTNITSMMRIKTATMIFMMATFLVLPGAIQPTQEKLLVGAIGFEPTTPCAQGRCATRLRYAPTLKDLQSVLNLIEV
jgi:hypothetical protein